MRCSNTNGAPGLVERFVTIRPQRERLLPIDAGRVGFAALARGELLERRH